MIRSSTGTDILRYFPPVTFNNDSIIAELVLDDPRAIIGNGDLDENNSFQDIKVQQEITVTPRDESETESEADGRQDLRALAGRCTFCHPQVSSRSQLASHHADISDSAGRKTTRSTSLPHRQQGNRDLGFVSTPSQHPIGVTQEKMAPLQVHTAETYP